MFFGPSEGANCNFVVGAEFGPTLGPPVLEGHSGASNTWNQTYFTLGRDNPLRLLAPLLFLL